VTFPLLAALVFTLPTVALALLVSVALWLTRKRQRRFWKVVGWVHLVLFPLHLFVTFPAVLGYVGSRLIPTRGDERLYDGPRISASGDLLVQTRQTLRAEQEAGAPSVDAAVLADVKARTHRVEGADGVTLQVYRVPAKAAPPTSVAVLVHGMFRSSIELEPVAKMLRNRGCECWLVDQRNHGGSTRAPFTGGMRESRDLIAAVRYVREQPNVRELPLVLFGVSLGTCAVSLALPDIDDVGGVVLDAPIEDLTAAAQRMLSFHREGDRRNFTFQYEPWRSLVITSLGLWSGFDVGDVRPIEVLATLPPDLPMLIVSEGLDDRAPPERVAELYERLPMPEGVKELWKVDDVGHGQAFLEQPAAYDAALGRLLDRLRR